MQRIMKIDISDHLAPHGKKQSIPEDYMEIVMAMRQTISEIIAEGINSGDFRPVEPDEACNVFSALLRGFHFKWVTIDDDYSVEESAELLLNYFLNGIRNVNIRDKGEKL